MRDPTASSSDLGAARSGGTDGRLSFHAGAHFCHRLRDPQHWDDIYRGLAASLGAGISMGFTEAASDDGEISGRGSPLERGIASGVMRVGWIGACPALPDPAFLDSRRDRFRHRVLRALGHRLDPEQVHGNAILASQLSGRTWRRLGLRYRHPDRECLSSRQIPVFSMRPPGKSAKQSGKEKQ